MTYITKKIALAVAKLKQFASHNIPFGRISKLMARDGRKKNVLVVLLGMLKHGFFPEKPKPRSDQPAFKKWLAKKPAIIRQTINIMHSEIAEKLNLHVNTVKNCIDTLVKWGVLIPYHAFRRGIRFVNYLYDDGAVDRLVKEKTLVPKPKELVGRPPKDLVCPFKSLQVLKNQEEIAVTSLKLDVRMIDDSFLVEAQERQAATAEHCKAQARQQKNTRRDPAVVLAEKQRTNENRFMTAWKRLAKGVATVEDAVIAKLKLDSGFSNGVLEGLVEKFIYHHDREAAEDGGYHAF